MRHVLTNALGAREQAEIHIQERALTGGETLLLCSDGLHTVVAPDQLLALLQQGGDLEERANSLVRAALDGGSHDNVTVVLVAGPGAT
jgi:serine/threonine protein phosphatase PrpC